MHDTVLALHEGVIFLVTHHTYTLLLVNVNLVLHVVIRPNDRLRGPCTTRYTTLNLICEATSMILLHIFVLYELSIQARADLVTLPALHVFFSEV